MKNHPICLGERREEAITIQHEFPFQSCLKTPAVVEVDGTQRKYTFTLDLNQKARSDKKYNNERGTCYLCVGTFKSPGEYRLANQCFQAKSNQASMKEKLWVRGIVADQTGVQSSQVDMG